MKSPQVSVSTLAKWLAVSERRCQQLVAQGVIPRDERGRYDLEVAVAAYIGFLKVRTTTEPGDDRKRLVKARADLAEIEAAKARDELVSSEAVAQVWGEICTNLKTRLRAIPSKATPLLAAESDPAVVHALLLGAIDQALTELADDPSIANGETEAELR